MFCARGSAAIVTLGGTLAAPLLESATLRATGGSCPLNVTVPVRFPPATLAGFSETKKEREEEAEQKILESPGLRDWIVL